ncbi:MAG: GvpL/GvpF family gas vesicle protein [Chlorobiaceae bacterium]
MDKQGIYIYGFVPAGDIATLTVELDRAGLYQIEYMGICAVVSDTRSASREHLDRERLTRLLVDHQQKLERVMSLGCSRLVPMQLGTIVSSGNDVIKILKNGIDILGDTFLKVADAEEIDLGIVWNDFQQLIVGISETKDVKALKEAIANKERCEESDGIQIGRLIKERIDQKNEGVATAVLAALKPFVMESKKHETMNDEMPLNYAFLVRKNDRDAFMDMLDRLDMHYAGSLVFKAVGPLPCYSFCTLEARVLEMGEIEKAKKLFGIDAVSSESELKKIYRSKASLNHPDKTGQTTRENPEDFIAVHNAYKLLLDYSVVSRHFSENIPDEPLYMVKIKN